MHYLMFTGAQSEDMWTPYKELVTIVNQYVGRPTTGSYAPFEAALRRHRQNFLSLMKNPVSIVKFKGQYSFSRDGNQMILVYISMFFRSAQKIFVCYIEYYN